MAPPSTAAGRAPLSTAVKIWMLSGALGSVTVLLWLTVGVTGVGEQVVPWWTLAIGFAVVEVLVVHIHLRQDAYSFSLAEVPLVIGLVAAAPGALIVGQLIGTTASLVLHRRQPPLKVGFNVANFAVGTTAGLLVFEAVLGTGDPLVPSGWLAVFAATMATSVVGTSLIGVVLRIVEGQVDLVKLTQVNLFGLLVAATNTSLGLAAMLALETEPVAIVLFGGIAATLLVAYRAYASERRHHESLEFLYASTRAFTERRELGAAVITLLENACEAFRSSVAELVLVSAPDDDESTVQRAALTRVRRNGEPVVMESVTMVEDPDLWELLVRTSDPVLIDRDRADPLQRRYLDRLGVDSAMLTELEGEDRTVGLLVVGGRLTDVTPFAASDLRLFATVASHAAMSLENDQLETSVTKLLELEQQLSHQAFHDAVTGLPNRRQFTRYLEEIVDDRRQSSSVVLFIDLDDFKAVNDTLGHQAGDEVLRVSARRLEACVRSDDVVARLGGDEFAVLLRPESSDAEATAARIVQAIGRPIVLEGGHEGRVGCSIGIAVAEDAETADELIRNADTAMYAAKTAGKGRMHRFTAQLYADVDAKHRLHRRIARGIEQREFEVHYQPILDVATEVVVGAEALLRWRDPEAGLVSAGRFIDFAESSGQSVPLGQMVVERAIQDATVLAEACRDDFWVTINVSGRQLARTDVAGDVRAALRASGLDPQQLVVEITETAMMSEIEQNLDRLRDLRALGVRLALDDFGTGHSSLSHLRTLPIDLLKVAKPFVDGVRDGVEEDTFLRVIVQLADTLGLSVVGEGVEDEGQAAFLHGLGCEYAEGWLWAAALERDDFVDRYGRPAAASIPLHEAAIQPS